jgi:hypothetical protein
VGFFVADSAEGEVMTETLQEFCDSRGVAVRVDRQRGVIRGVKILGLKSRNGRTYLPEALSQAAGLYEEAKVNVNHPRGNPGGPRDYQDRIGVIRHVAARLGEGLFADFHFNPKHALAEQLLWDAEHAPENVGFSHNVQAQTRRQGDHLVVEAITKVQSVDLVADPATTRGLFESRESGAAVEGDSPIFAARKSGQSPAQEAGESAASSPVRPSLSVEELKRDYPDLVEALCGEQAAELSRLRGEVDRLRVQEAVHQKRLLVRRLLREYHLPDPDTPEPQAGSIVSDRFLESLLAAESEQAMRELILERSELVRSLGSTEPVRRGADGRPLSRDQHLLHTLHKLDTKAFVEAIT